MSNPSIRPTGPVPFAPDSGVSLPGLANTQNTATIAVTSTSARVPISLNGAMQVEISNAGSSWCFVVFGDVTVVATAPVTSSGSYPIGPGQTKIVTLVNVDAITNVAAICTAGLTTTFYASPGVGLS